MLWLTCRSLCVLSLSLTVSLALSERPVHAQTVPPTASAVVKYTMAKYAKIASYHAECNWSESFGALPAMSGTTRVIWYQKPNRFKVVSTMSGGRMVQTSVSDGSKLVEYAIGVGTGAQRYTAPPSIADATSMQMGHPMFCGSLLYKFFGGPGRYSDLVDETKMLVSFGAPVTIDGQPCKTVKFWATGPTYGKTEVAIGSVDGLVHRIKYGSEPLMEMIKSGEAQALIKEALKSPEVPNQLQKSDASGSVKAAQDALGNGQNMPTSSDTTEQYLHIAVGSTINPAVFSTQVPSSLAVQDVGGGTQPQPPVEFGKQAPAFSVTGLDGVKATSSPTSKGRWC